MLQTYRKDEQLGYHTLSTRDLEMSPGDMALNPAMVFDLAEIIHQTKLALAQSWSSKRGMQYSPQAPGMGQVIDSLQEWGRPTASPRAVWEALLVAPDAAAPDGASTPLVAATDSSVRGAPTTSTDQASPPAQFQRQVWDVLMQPAAYHGTSSAADSAAPEPSQLPEEPCPGEVPPHLQWQATMTAVAGLRDEAAAALMGCAEVAGPLQRDPELLGSCLSRLVHLGYQASPNWLEVGWHIQRNLRSVTQLACYRT